MEDIVILGAGSHGRGIRTIIEAINDVKPTYRLFGFLDDNYRDIHRASVIGPSDIRLPERPEIIVGINNSQVRSEVYTKCGNKVLSPIIHPTAIIGPGVHIGFGSVIHAGVIITGDVHIGSNVHINIGSTISQGSTIQDHTTISPGVNIAGEVKIGFKCQIGTGVAISNLIEIGNDVIVGAGAVVVDNLESNHTYAGVPARRIDYSDRQRSRGILE